MTTNAAVSSASQLKRSRSPRPQSSHAALAIPATGIELWMLLLTQFDPTQEQFTAQQIARVLGVSPDTVSFHCRKLWPREDGEAREVRAINFAGLVWLVRYYARQGRRLPELRALYSKLRASKRISEQFPRDCPAVCQGKRVVEAKRRSLLSGN